MATSTTPQPDAADPPENPPRAWTLTDREINGSVSWFFDEVWSVVLGGPQNGIDAETTVYSSQEAAEWLRANAVRLHPDSKFAKRFHRTGR